MCIIVDANKMGIFLSDPMRDEVEPIHKWLINGSGNLVYSTGGAFAKEVTGFARDKLASYVQAGRATLIPDAEFAEDERQLRNDPIVHSDDPHVLALAKASRARVLYTGDNKLIKDFKNKNIIDKPRGKIYSGRKQAGLLTRSTCRT